MVTTSCGAACVARSVLITLFFGQSLTGLRPAKGEVVRGYARRMVVYNLTVPARSSSEPITLPVSDSPVLILGSVLSPEARGTGTVTLTYHSRPPGNSVVNPALSWVGLSQFAYDEPASTGLVRRGVTSIEGIGTSMIGLAVGRTGAVDLVIGPALNQCRVRNGDGTPKDVIVKILW
jgi:hypothetical protein